MVWVSQWCIRSLIFFSWQWQFLKPWKDSMHMKRLLDLWVPSWRKIIASHPRSLNSIRKHSRFINYFGFVRFIFKWSCSAIPFVCLSSSCETRIASKLLPAALHVHLIFFQMWLLVFEHEDLILKVFIRLNTRAFLVSRNWSYLLSAKTKYTH